MRSNFDLSVAGALAAVTRELSKCEALGLFAVSSTHEGSFVLRPLTCARALLHEAAATTWCADKSEFVKTLTANLQLQSRVTEAFVQRSNSENNAILP
jgi:hypothetical protein